ncbi:MAG: pesticin C-terminus-like muramidase [Legionella sp.]|nr:pesticin C-terminus-like muramidase [Legionella sp.]
MRPATQTNDHRTSYQYDELGQVVSEKTQGGRVTTYTYDSTGHILTKTISDEQNHAIRQQQYRYDSLGRVINSLDEMGSMLLARSGLTKDQIELIWQQHSIHFEYDSAGLLHAKTDALNQTTLYFYDESRQLKYTINADGSVTEHLYNPFNQLILSKKYSAQLKSNCKNATTHDIEERLNLIQDERLDETTRYKYNSIGQLIAKYIGSNGIVTTEYNTFGEIEKTTERIDATHSKLTAFIYDNRGLLTRNIVDPYGIAKDIKFHYDSFGWLIQESDSKLNNTNYTLNKRGEKVIITNASTKRKMIQYDAFGRELYETNSGGNRIVKSFSYNDQANTLTLNYSDVQSPIITQFNAYGDQISIKDANGFSTEFHYDAKGQLIRIDSPENTYKEYQYDAQGQLRFEHNAAGQKIAYSYDAAGHLLTKTLDPDGLKLTTSYQYDGVGRQLQITEANGRIKEFKYDNNGNLIQSCIDPYGLNLITTFTYDDRGLLLRQTEINSQGKNRVTAYEWDPLGRRTASIIDPDGLKITTTYQYDANDNLICTTDANQHSIHFAYDEMNRCQYQIDPRGVVSEYRYDGEGNKTQSITYAQQIPKISQYDAARVKAIIKEDIHDQHTFQVFDNKGQIIAAFDARGYATGYRYDGNGNLLTTTRYAKAVSLEELKKGNMSLPLEEQARKEHFIYDGLNQLRFKRDNSGHVTESSYNLNGELIRTTQYAESIPTGNIESITLSYIENHLTHQPDRDQSIHYGYDKAGRLITELSAQGVAKSHQYDATGLLIASTIHATPIDPSKIKNLDHLELPLNPKDRTRYFVYDAAGRERYRISPEGRVLERRYDVVGNIAAELTYSTPIRSSVYSESSITQIINNNSAPYKLTQYQYDVAGRLTTHQQGQTQTKYTYDAQGNVLAKTDANFAVTHYFYNETNQLIETQTPPILVSGISGQEKRSVITRNSYDSFGNIISIVRDAEGLKQTLLYEYDTGNNKIKTIYPNGAVNNAKSASSRQRQEVNTTLTEEIKYNGFGQVIASSDKSGNWKYFIYDSNQGLLCYSVDNEGGVIEHKYDSFNRIINKSVYASPIILNPNTNYSIESIASMIHSGKADRHEFYAYNRDNQLIESSRDSVPTFNAKTGHYDHLKPTTRTTYNTFGEVIKTAVRINETEWAETYNYYDKDGHLSARVDAAGYVTTYTQNGYGETEAITEYAFIAPHWDEENYTRPQSSNKDRIVVFTYDALGQITSKTLKQVQYERRKGTSSVYESFISDITTTYTYDALGHMTSTTDGKGNTSNWYYDEMGQLIAKIAPKTQDGRGATTYSYDALGHLVETRRWSLGVSEADTKQFKLKGSSTSDTIIRQEYDLDNNLISETDALNHSIYYSYDANGNLARSWQEFKQPNQQTLIQDMRYRYDKENRLIQTATFKNNDAVKTEDVQYNTFGEVIAKGINGNYNTHVDYDCLGRVWRSNTQGFYQIYVYDLMDHVTQVVTSTNSWRPDKSNRGVDLSAAIFEEVTIYDELSWHYDLQRQNNTYDKLGRLVQQSKEFAARSWDEGMDDRLDYITQSQTVDRWGNMLRFTNALGYETRYEYNAYNQVIRQELPEVRVVDEHGVSRLLKPVNTYAYDELGQAVAMIDANGHSVSKEYDALGRVIKETDAKGYSRSKHYNLLDQLTSATNESGGITTYAYDQMNRLVSVSSPKTRQDYEYNELGQLIKQRNGQQEETQFWYDTLGNQITQRDARGYDTHFQYDDSGRKIKQTDAMGHSQSWMYSDDGRLKQHTDMGGHTSYYQYNTNGTLIEERSTTGKHVEYHYRGNGDLYQYADIAQQEVINYSYDAAGQVIIKESGKGGSGKTSWIKEIDHYQYDALGRLSQVRRRHPDDTDSRFPDQDHALLSIDYDYDAVGNIRHTKVNANYTGYEQVQNEDYYLYDENNRMTVNKGKLINGQISINNSQGSAITYDAVGNISDAEKYENGQVQHYHYQYNLENQLELIQKNSRSIQAKFYDRAGRVIQENLFDEYGNLAQKNLAAYEKGLLIAQSIKNSNDWEVSKTVFQYDRTGNMEDLSMRVNTAPGTRGYNLRHQYTYALWDNYQQSSDSVTRTVDGQAAISGRSTRNYDLNGQLIYSTDHDAGGGPSNSTSYWTSSVEGIKAREDKDGKTSYLSVGGKTIGDLRLDVYGKQHLTVYGGFTPSGSQRKAEPGNFLWQTDHTAGTIGAFLERSPGDSADGALPESTQDNLGTYTLQAGDTLESIALLAYGDSSLWYLIADANGISDRSAQASNGGPLHIGQRINLPAVASSQHQTNRTHKVINATQMIGDTSATAPMPATPPPLPRHHNRIFSRIIVGIISVVTTVLTAGIVGAMIGAGSMLSGISSLFALGSKVLAGGALLETGGAMAAGFAAGFVGNIAGQGAAKAFGMQEHIDFKNAFVSGLATAATAGFSKIVPPNSAYNALVKSLDNAGISKNFSIASAAEMMEQNAASQVFNVTLRRHQHFDWEELGVTGLTAGLMGGAAGQELNKTIKKIDKTGILENQLSTLTRATLQSNNINHFDATQVLIDNLGSAIGSKLLSTLNPKITSNETPTDELYLSDTLLDITHPERQEKAVYQNYLAQLLANNSNGYDSDSLEFKSDLLKSDSTSETFENRVYLGEKHGKDQFVSEALALSEKSNLNNIDIYNLERVGQVWSALNEINDTNIDFSAVSEFEGGQAYQGYLLLHKGSVVGNSGINFATGFDVGQYSSTEIKQFNFSKELEQKLLPFVNAKKQDAINLLPLAKKTLITIKEANQIDFIIKGHHLKHAISNWNHNRLKSTPLFKDLSIAQQTVLFSRTFHQGVNMPKTQIAKEFYKSALNNDWVLAEKHLKNYETKQRYYQNRVLKESNMLKRERNYE